MESRSKSRSFRRKKLTTPSGRRVMHFHRRMPGKAQCSGCGDNLKGVPRNIPSKIHNTSKSKKRPERPFGGMLCSRCSRQKIKEDIRKIFSLK